MDALSLGTEVATWAIKDFSVVLRQQITRAARMRDCTVAEWLHAYFQAHGVDGQQFEVVKIAQVELPKTEINEVAVLVEAAARLAETGDRMPKGLRANLARTLSQAARERRPAPTPRPTKPRAMIGHETPANSAGLDENPSSAAD